MHSEKVLIKMVADACVKIGRAKTTYGAYCVSYDDLLELDTLDDGAPTLGKDIAKAWLTDHHAEITKTIEARKCVSQVDDDYDEHSRKVIGWDIDFYLNYCPNIERDE